MFVRLGRVGRFRLVRSEWLGFFVWWIRFFLLGEMNVSLRCGT
jgi:hypothetical protein